MTLLETRRLVVCRRRAQYLQRLRRSLDAQAFRSARSLAERDTAHSSNQPLPGSRRPP